MKSQRTSLVPLFRFVDKVAQVKQRVDETLDISGAVVIPEDNPEAGYTGLGEEDVPTIFKPLWLLPRCHFGRKRMNWISLTWKVLILRLWNLHRKRPGLKQSWIGNMLREQFTPMKVISTKCMVLSHPSPMSQVTVFMYIWGCSLLLITISRGWSGPRCPPSLSLMLGGPWT